MIKTLRISLLLFVFFILNCFGSFAQRTYVVAVGLNNYDNGQNSLPCSVGDARAICSFFKNYNNSDVFLLIDKNATRDHILRTLKNQFTKSKESDQIIFAYSGHGFDGGITCYDTSQVIYCSEIQSILRQAKAKRRIMFINSCHSGSFSKKYGNSPKNNNYKSNTSNVMLYLSSRANEYSWENYSMPKSYFFNRLIEGLQGAADLNRDKRVTSRELFNYVNQKVITDTNNLQHPQMFGKFPDDMVVVYVK